MAYIWMEGAGSCVRRKRNQDFTFKQPHTFFSYGPHRNAFPVLLAGYTHISATLVLAPHVRFWSLFVHSVLVSF